MKKYLLLLVIYLQLSIAQAQKEIINTDGVTRIMNVLASDSMKGRKTFTPYIDSAANFIAKEFSKAGLKYFDGLQDYLQTFYMVSNKNYDATATINDMEIAGADIFSITPEAHLVVSENSGYAISFIDSSKNFFREIFPLLQSDSPRVIFVSRALQKDFLRLKKFNRPFFSSQRPVIVALTDEQPQKFTFTIESHPEKMPLSNVVGILPGKSRKHEYVIFSAHYDHLGVGKPDMKGDSIYNGANDDASGTTAVIGLAKYFAEKANNERTLIFVAFTAEEMGGFGSKYFSEQLNPDDIVAMFNIEMIGTPSQWGEGNAYITGYEKSDFGKILQQSVPDSSFIFHPDPYTDQNLFYRSDNATLAALGVPAHTISTSNMHNEPYYHKQGDEVSTLDMKQLAHTIRAIARASVSIVQGKETPTRVEKVKD